MAGQFAGRAAAKHAGLVVQVAPTQVDAKINRFAPTADAYSASADGERQCCGERPGVVVQAASMWTDRGDVLRHLGLTFGRQAELMYTEGSGVSSLYPCATSWSRARCRSGAVWRHPVVLIDSVRGPRAVAPTTASSRCSRCGR